jgi:hypothetical protein
MQNIYGELSRTNDFRSSYKKDIRTLYTKWTQAFWFMNN